MSDEDHDFSHQGGGDNASKTYPLPAGALKKGGYVCINGRPCKVIDLSVSKTGKHGHAKVSIVATDIFTGNRLEDQAPSTHNVEVPFPRGSRYAPDVALATQIKEQFDSGKEVLVVVVSAMGTEQVLQTKNAAEK
ncbi:translation elongation factor IF5A [Leishmania donovani]|uniref:Eukaryotic translation initiation factor 5A n=1 Tax=Leishmania donovani TaxID=5661 RepID=A0A504WVI1_LEIDO|nr:translation elongation factor IF5A [Leishmania donovani]